jgi:glycosyltransferase involved in cell wall biosynthesis
MRGLFYFRTHRNDPANQGVVQKCEAYVRAFQANGMEADVVWYSDKGLIFKGKLLASPLFNSRKKSIGHLALFYAFGDFQIARSINFQQYNFLLIRHMPTHPAFLFLLKKAKKTNPNLKIIIELPTWPYDAEMKGLSARIMLGIDRLFRQKLRLFTDRFLHYGRETEIWGVPTIFVQNGIDVQRIPKQTPKTQANKGLQMIFIGSMGHWHGLDRLLHGMYEFRQKRAENQSKVNLKIVGVGAASEETQALVLRLGLETCVQMIPPCSGAEFDAHMAQADVGIGTLGIHRIGIPLNSALKHRTYCAYGLPFVFGGADADFPAEYPFCLRVESDETAVSIDAILQFMDGIYQQYSDVNQQIRAYAETQLDWKVKITPVLEYLSNTH